MICETFLDTDDTYIFFSIGKNKYKTKKIEIN